MIDSNTSPHPPVRWGILGTGHIASRFAEGLRFVPDAQLLAVGSRTQSKAEQFALALGVPRAFGSYDDLVNDRELDVVYIATPNPMHKENCLLALEAGKAVICEKPFAMDAGEASQVIELARRKRLFCMEAMWMRFLPAMARLRRLIDSGVIGEIRLVRADFAIPKTFEPGNRFFSREMGGGAMLNFGVYLVSFASFLLGTPCAISAQASFAASGVDEQSVAVFRYSSGAIATLTASIRNYLPCEAIIVGSKGEIRVHNPLFRPERVTVTQFADPEPPSSASPVWLARLKRNALISAASAKFDGLLDRLFFHRNKRYADRFQGNGFNYEAAEVNRCLRGGEQESPIMPLDETLRVMEAIDCIHSQMRETGKQ